MRIQIFTEDRRKNKRSRNQKKASPLFRVFFRTLRWIRNFLLILIACSLLITLALRWVNPPYTSFMVSQRLSSDWVPYAINWVPLNEVSPHLLIAVVASEDQKFPNHFGFDLKAIQSAIEANKTQRRIRGASTITQQVAKNIFLWPKKSLFRKGLEAYFSLLIEALWPKWRILEVYLNIAQFGPNVFGAKNAAYTHFKKHANQLTEREAALLAAVLPNPHKMNASQPSNYVQQRATNISAQARSLGGVRYLHSIWK